MSTTTSALAPAPWLDANRRYLSAEFDRIGALIEFADDDDARQDAVTTAERMLAAVKQSMSEDAAIDVLATAFSLTPFERDIVLLCASVEMEAHVAHDVRRYSRSPVGRVPEQPTFGRALAALPGAHWSAVTPGRPLRHWPLVMMGSGNVTDAPLRLEERILHFLAGINELDPTVEPFIRQSSPRTVLSTATHSAIAESIVGGWAGNDGRWTPVHLVGDDRDGHEDIAWQAIARLGLGLYTVNAHDLPPRIHDRATLATRWTREAILLRGGLFVQADAISDGAAGAISPNALGDFISRIGAPLLLSSPAAIDLPDVTRFTVNVPTPLEQRGLWHTVLGDVAEGWVDAIDVASSQFRLSARDILATGSRLVESGPVPTATQTGPSRFYQEIRRHRPARILDGLVHPIEPTAGWDDLVLADAGRDVLHEIVDQVRHRTRVYEEWGFAHRGARGLGISALFAGESGTGKTMAAEVLARELGLELYRIDLSAVVSKYIGETEKNLQRVFDAADESGAVLLFDEADALFGKRSEVKDSHDRYANIEVSYLLQRMEAYRGLAVLTTNAPAALDRSFHRRLRFVVVFPFPDAVHREQIWRRVFPPQTPLGELDYATLARLPLSGGAIRNIAVLSAFRAAASNAEVTMEHLAWGARTELAKAEKPPAEAELRRWVT